MSYGLRETAHTKDAASAGVRKEQSFAKILERRSSPRNQNALQRFRGRDFAESVPPPSAFTLT
jgi:hypothetical protein